MIRFILSKLFYIWGRYVDLFLPANVYLDNLPPLKVKQIKFFVPSLFFATSMVVYNLITEIEIYGVTSLSAIGSMLGIASIIIYLFLLKFFAMHTTGAIIVILSGTVGTFLSIYQEYLFETGNIYLVIAYAFFGAYVIGARVVFWIQGLTVSFLFFCLYLVKTGHQFPFTPHFSEEIIMFEGIKSIFMVNLVCLFIYYYEKNRVESLDKMEAINSDLMMIRKAVECCSEGIIVFDAEEKHLYHNSAFAAIFGIDLDQFASSDYAKIYNDLKVEGDIKKELDRGNGWRGELIIRENNSSEKYIFLVVDQIKNSANKQIGTIRVYSDITEKKHSDSKLMKAIAREKAADEANEMKSEFVSNISHEIRTPMHGILSYVKFAIDDLQKSGQPGEEVLKDLKEIEASGNNLMRLLNDLLDLSRLEAGRMSWEMDFNDIGDLTNEVLDEMVKLAQERGLTFDVNVDENVNTWAQIDSFRIKQVIRNMLSNSIKYSWPHRIIKIEITNVYEGSKQFVQFSISDEGKGVPPDETESVFDKFTQSSVSRTGAGGTGLGLSISRQIIEMHNGKIWLESRQITNDLWETVVIFTVPAHRVL